MRTTTIPARSIRLLHVLALAGVVLIASIVGVRSLSSSPTPVQATQTAILLRDGIVVCTDMFASDLQQQVRDAGSNWIDIDGWEDNHVQADNVVGIITVEACPSNGMTATQSSF